MPQLQELMLRFAGVSSVIAEKLKEKLDKKAFISAGLIHDLGNMAKIKLDAFPEFAQPLGVSYWEKVLTEFKQKYGSDDYTATYKILKDLGVSETIYYLEI